METDLKKLRGRCFALDSQTARVIDRNGFLHVPKNRLTCDQVAGYYGFELPKESGADPAKIYYAYRPADELQKALNTYNGVPLLSCHEFDFADKPRRELRIGAVGDQAAWDDPFITNSLTVWDKDAIEAIQSGKTRELSCGYLFRIDWTPGETPDGTHYDFVMRDIKCNHVALVETARADGCRVADSNPMNNKEIRMNQETKCADDFTEFSRKAIEGAGVQLTPEQIDALVRSFAEAHAKWQEQSAAAAQREIEGTRDADPAPAKDADGDKPAEPAAKPAEGEKPAEGAKPAEPQAKADDCDGQKAADAAITKAVDAAVAKAVDAAKKSVAARYAAAEEVRAYAGILDPMKFETPEQIYQAGLKAINVTGVTDSAAPEVFRNLIAKRNAPVARAADAGTDGALASLINSL